MGTSIRPDGIANAAATLRNMERKQAVIANNLANVSTPGFKGERVFARVLAGHATPVLDTVTDMRTGSITVTGAPLDLALEKDGFFVTRSGGGEHLTRGGSLRIDDARQLVDVNGDVLLGEDDPKGGVRGPVVIPDGATDVSIDRAGAVVVNGKQVARLRLERVGDHVRLEHLGAGKFAPPAARESIAFGERGIRQGALEESNVGSVESLVDLIGVQRAYAGAQRVLTTMDAARGITVSDIGKPV